jgi:hypothetical protein
MIVLIVGCCNLSRLIRGLILKRERKTKTKGVGVV